MLKGCVVAAAVIVLFAAPARAQAPDEGGCVYDRQIYPEGYEMCQGGELKRCDQGAWSDIGMCASEGMPPPRSEGGDVEIEPDE
jgi:hypothetical protein